jgi:hypothetical protein
MAKRKPRKKKIPPTTPGIPIAGVDYELKLPERKPNKKSRFKELPACRLSYSAIDTYLKCPWKYHNTYVLGLREPPSAAMQEGKAMADVCEWAGKHYLKKGEWPKLPDASVEGRKSFMRHFKGVKEDYSRTDILNRQALFLERWWEMGCDGPDMEPINVGTVPGLEYEFLIDIAGVPVYGFVDIVEALACGDVKVAKTTRFYKPDRSLQLGLYCYVMSEITGIDYLKAFYVVMCKQDGKIEYLPATLDSIEWLRWWIQSKVANVAMGISKGVFPCCNESENFLCSKKWCQFYDDCFGRIV